MEQGGTREQLQARITRVLDGDAPFGLVLVMDENGSADFGHNVDVVEVRDALLAYAREVAAYPGDV